MSRLIPDDTELAPLRFLVGGLPVRARYALAGALFMAGGLAVVFVAHGAWAGVVAILAGHLLLWVSGARPVPVADPPADSLSWLPVPADWVGRLRVAEEDGARWDLAPWDITRWPGVATLLLLMGAVAIIFALTASLLDLGVGVAVAVAAAALLLPAWFNGRRPVWHPSMLLRKGEVIEQVARRFAEGDETWEAVPLLGLAPHARGRMPMDARLLVRPIHDDGLTEGLMVTVDPDEGGGLRCAVLSRGAVSLPDHLPAGVSVEAGAGGQPMIRLAPGTDPAALVSTALATACTWH